MVRVRNHLRCHAARACNDSSIAMSGVSERSRNGYLSEYLCASQRAARSGVLAASALSKRRHVPPRLPHEPYGRPLSRCEALRQKAARLRGTYCKRTLAPRNTQQKRVTRCGVRRARCTNAASRTRPRWPRSERRKRRKPHARHRGRRSRPAAAVSSARQAWAGRRRAGALQRRRGSAAASSCGLGCALGD
jgi:phage protein D